jgi:hypothetical protein
MAHYAFLDENNIVVEVITGVDETELIEGKDPETWYAEFRGLPCKRTSYNNNYRKNFAGQGYFYNEELDAFISPRPYLAWILNEETARWEPPVAMPSDGGYYKWDDDSASWIEQTSLAPEEI